MPIISFDALDAVPEGLREVAKTDENTGKVIVNVVPEAKLSEFRDRNINLSKSNEDLAAKFSLYQSIVGEDPDAFRADLEEARTIRQRVKDGDLKEGRQIQEEIARRTEDMRKGYEDQLKVESREKAAWMTKAQQENARFREQVVITAIRDACTDPALGVMPTAARDITQRAKDVFRVGDDGKLTAFNGDAVIYGPNGADSITPREWVAKLREEAPHMFKQSGGAGGGESTTGARKIAGKFTSEQWSKMSAKERLSAANGESGARF